MQNLRDLALGIIGSSPQVANNPMAQRYLDVIRRGDAKQGEQIARNLCQSYGVTPEQAIQQARSMFHF